MSNVVNKTKRSREEQPTAIEEEPSFALQPPSAEEAPLSKKAQRQAKKLAEAAQENGAGQEVTEGEGAEVAGEDDTPALSHKEKRMAKRRKLAGIPERAPAPVLPSSVPTIGSQRAPGGHEGGIAVGATPAKGAHGIWIGNMNFATTSKELLAWFEERGLREITRINMPKGKRSHENNRGFAYLDFPSNTDVEIAVGLSEQHLDGRKLLIKSSTDYTGRPAPSAVVLPADLPASALVDPSPSSSSFVPTDPSAPVRPKILEGPQGQTLNRTARKILDRQRNPAGPTLFLGNLGFETQVEDIRMMFDAHQRAAAAWAPKTKEDKKEAKVESSAETKAGKKGEEKMEVDEDRDDDDSDSEEEEEGSDDSSSEEEEEEAEEEKAEADSDADSDAEEGSDAAEPVKPKRVRAKKPAKKEPKKPLDLTKAKDAGIRKIRLGTFEDTGKCKGWAFVDFHLPEQCTRALLNVRNHTLDGRTLNVEYASAEAVRRGGIGTRNAQPGVGRGGGRGGASAGRGNGRPAQMPKKGRDWDDQDVRDSAKVDFFDQQAEGEAAPRQRSEFGFRPSAPRGGGRGGARGGARGGRSEGAGDRNAPRAKPGAALAGAQRASEGIVASTGRKITFDS